MSFHETVNGLFAGKAHNAIPPATTPNRLPSMLLGKLPKEKGLSS